MTSRQSNVDSNGRHSIENPPLGLVSDCISDVFINQMSRAGQIPPAKSVFRPQDGCADVPRLDNHTDSTLNSCGMGLDINDVQLFIAARKQGVQFGRTIMIGRNSLNVFPSAMVAILERHGLPSEKFRKAGPECAYAEPFFEALGAVRVDSLDNSDFEGAQFIHDLNQPIPASWKDQFDVVYDGGTLEHVFNFPTALRNCMELLREGGRFFTHTCANNLCGHGFYQFSPELFYRALSAENGFEVERMVIHRVGPYGNWYEVSDPNAIRSRVELITFTPMQMLVQAKRTSIKPIFARHPQQSDYTALWEASRDAQDSTNLTPVVRKPRLPALARFIHAMLTGLEFYRRQSLRNRRFFCKVPKECE